MTNQLLDLDFLTREPPPPPRYDATGKRINLPENRARERLMEEKTQLIEDGIRTNPLFKACFRTISPPLIVPL